MLKIKERGWNDYLLKSINSKKRLVLCLFLFKNKDFTHVIILEQAVGIIRRSWTGWRELRKLARR